MLLSLCYIILMSCDLPKLSVQCRDKKPTRCTMSTTMLKRDVGTGDLCDNIGLVGVSAKWSYVTASPSHHDQTIPMMTPSCLLCMLTIPIFPFLKFNTIVW